MLLEFFIEVGRKRREPVVFDGLVLESFTEGDTGRWHVTQIESITLEEGKKGRTMHIDAGRYGGRRAVIPEDSIPALGEMIAAINAVRAERYDMAPIAST